MKIALVNTALPWGGTTTISLFLAAGLRELGIPIEIFSLSQDHPMESEFDRLQIPVHCCDDRKMIFEDRMAKTLVALRDYGPSVVIAGLGPPAFEILRYIPKGVFRIGMLQDNSTGIYELAREYQQFVDHFAAVSQAIKNNLAEKYPDIPSSYLPGGILLDEKEHRVPQAHQPLKIFYFGRLQESQKQVRLIPKIWRALHERKIPVVWTILGEGPEESFLRENLTEAVQAGEIVFSKPIMPHDLPKIIAAQDIYILCSAHEGGPLTLLEAMGHGLVPVCGDIPCLVQEVINADNGFRVPQGEPEAYAEAIECLHRNRNLLEQMSSRGRAIIKRDYTAIVMAQRYVEVVEKKADPVGIPVWPAIFVPRPPFRLEKIWYMSPYLLPLRRLFKRLKSLKA